MVLIDQVVDCFRFLQWLIGDESNHSIPPPVCDTSDVPTDSSVPGIF